MIAREDVEHVAELARLALTAAEKDQLSAQLNSILTYIEKLNELDTRDVEPTSHVLPMSNVFRDDEVRPSLDRTEVLRNAPEESHFFFTVPRIIEE
jgi:aspartyl-tRNA(Asn)/glutamyl-tRNA(Gln) amidotransferase subunit C